MVMSVLSSEIYKICRFFNLYYFDNLLFCHFSLKFNFFFPGFTTYGATSLHLRLLDLHPQLVHHL